VCVANAASSVPSIRVDRLRMRPKSFENGAILLPTLTLMKWYKVKCICSIYGFNATTAPPSNPIL
jgi:hypothetical protein